MPPPWGQGTLFLPINAGLNGPLVLILMALLAYPLTYLPHRALCRLVLSGSRRDGDITDVVEEHFGTLAGKGIMVLYLLAFFLSCWFTASLLPMRWRAF